MGIISIGTGTCTLGYKQTDKDGNVVKEAPPRWEYDQAGGCVAIAPLNQDTMEPDGPAEIYGDYDAVHYLARVLELLRPARQTNIPNLADMIRAAAQDGVDLCEYCRDPRSCRDCIMEEWKNSTGGE